MLSTNKTSRLRLFSGSAAIGLLTLGGLAATASGTQAAERVRSSVQTATGVDIASLDHLALPVAVTAVAPVAAAAPVAAPVPVTPVAQTDVPPPPPPPPPPTADPVPPAPPAPPAALAPLPPLGSDEDSAQAMASPDGKTVHRRVVRIVRRDKDGKVTSEDFAGMPEIPEVSSRNCPGDGERHQMVLNEKKDGKRVIIICTNRIGRVAREGAAVAANAKDIERNAYRSALAGLRSAQERMRSDVRMGEEARKQAVQAIDQSIKEIEEDLAKVN